MNRCSDLVNQAGDGLLGIACWHGKLDVVKILLGFGADVDAVNANGSSPLHRACYRNNVAIAGALLAFGANHNLRDKVHTR
jgi:ankyrin repeat protein